MRVKFWGTRGSIPAPGPATVRYGGNTPCVEVRSRDGALVILDCGTGIRELGLTLVGQEPVTGHILLSHTHWDHIQGFPFFAPALSPGNRFTIHAKRDEEKRLEDVLAGQQEYAYFPLSLGQMGAEMRFHEIVEPNFDIDSIRVSLHELHHPEPTASYRLEVDGKVLVYASDHEPFGPGWPASDGSGAVRPGASGLQPDDLPFVRFARAADLLIMDAQYSAPEYRERMGWGHSSFEYATAVAIAAGAKRLALFHHDPAHTDVQLDEFVAKCRRYAGKAGAEIEVFAAAERQQVEL